jgi:hypothetical protein
MTTTKKAEKKDEIRCERGQKVLFYSSLDEKGQPSKTELNNNKTNMILHGCTRMDLP